MSYCKICGKYSKQMVVLKADRKNKKGRIAWTRDGMCLDCYTRMKRKKPKAKSRTEFFAPAI